MQAKYDALLSRMDVEPEAPKKRGRPKKKTAAEVLDAVQEAPEE